MEHAKRPMNLAWTRSLSDATFLHYQTILLPSLIAYLALVRFFRYHRLKKLHQRFRYPSRESFSKMTFDDAFAIHDELVHLEFPRIMGTATMFALFKASAFEIFRWAPPERPAFSHVFFFSPRWIPIPKVVRFFNIV